MDLENVRSFLFKLKDGTELRLVEKDNYDKLVKRIKELEVLEDDLKDKRIVYIDTPEFKENYIPKQKVKDVVKEAIEILERMVKSYIEADECGLSNNDFKHEIRAMQTVLSMLKEKDKEIEE